MSLRLASPPVPVVPMPGSNLAIFDLDRTLHPGSSLVDLGRVLVAEGHVRRRVLLSAAIEHRRFKRRGADDQQVDGVRDRALAAVRGVRREPLLELTSEVAERVVARVTPAARAVLRAHLASGDFVVVLSASPQELVEHVAHALDAHRGIGTRGEIHDGRFTGRVDGAFCYGSGKLARLREALGPVDLTDAWAYADSLSDEPLLAACGHPVAVNPDRGLLAVAQAKGWPILRFA
jgi:HAD superfamily hydrolase (TIGR01490 family)